MISKSKNYEQDSKVQFVVDAVYAFAYALQDMKQVGERQRDRETERQRDRGTEGQRDRESEREERQKKQIRDIPFVRE